MEEDLELNLLIKTSLESGGAFGLRRPVRRRVAPWLGGVLLAASVAGVVSLRHPAFPVESRVVEAICLLSEAEDVDLEVDGQETAAELLQAWQSAGVGW